MSETLLVVWIYPQAFFCLQRCVSDRMSMYVYTYIHTLHYITLHYITLHYITLHYITLHYITLHYITLHYITLHYITLHYITLHTYHDMTWHDMTSHHITSHHITWHDMTWHDITLHYITLHTLHICIYIQWELGMVCQKLCQNNCQGEDHSKKVSFLGGYSWLHQPYHINYPYYNWAVFKIPLSFHYTGWVVAIPLLDDSKPQ